MDKDDLETRRIMNHHPIDFSQLEGVISPDNLTCSNLKAGLNLNIQVTQILQDSSFYCHTVRYSSICKDVLSLPGLPVHTPN
jgi:hypothetical protein